MHHATMFTSLLAPPLLHGCSLSLSESPLRYPVEIVALHTGSIFISLPATLGRMIFSLWLLALFCLL